MQRIIRDVNGEDVRSEDKVSSLHLLADLVTNIGACCAARGVPGWVAGCCCDAQAEALPCSFSVVADTAVDFIHETVGGLAFLAPYLRSQEGPDLRAAAMGVLANAASNNPKFVISLVRKDFTLLGTILEGMADAAEQPLVGKVRGGDVKCGEES